MADIPNHKMIYFDIVFRSCSTVNSVHGGVRVLKIPKSELLLGCLASLVDSLRYALEHDKGFQARLVVIDDHSDPACVEKMRRLLGDCPFATEFRQLGQTSGNAASIRACYDYARAQSQGLIYFVEDDYLHDERAILEMLQASLDFSREMRQPVVIHPCDHPDRYRMIYPSSIVPGRDRHWRTIQHTTGTFLLDRQTLDQFWEHYEAFAGYGVKPGICEDNTINRVYEKVPCFSPLPSLATHLQDEASLSPYVDWQSLWERYVS